MTPATPDITQADDELASAKRKLITPKRLALIAAIVLLVTGNSFAASFDLAPNHFSVFSEGSLSIDTGVSITGNAGAAGNVWFGQGAGVYGNLYSGGDFSTGQYAFVDGRAIAAGSVWLDQSASVDGRIDAGGDIGLDRNASAGSLFGGRDVGLDRDVRIEGNVHADRNVWFDRDVVVTGNVNHGGSASINGNAVVHGSVTQGGAADPDTWSFAPRTSPTILGGSGSQWISKNNDTTFNPGTHGQLSTDKENIIRLTAGTYDFKSIWIDRDSQIIADTSDGDVFVNIQNGLSVGRDVSLTTEGGGNFIVTTGGNISLDRGAFVDADLVAFGSLSIGRDANIDGGLYAKGNMWIDRDSTITGTLNFSGNDTTVPEPNALLILGTMMLGMLRRPRHRTLPA